MNNLKDKVVVVTGGAGLIGLSFVEVIINEGGIAIIADIDSNLGRLAKRELSLKLDTKNIDFVELDVTSKASLVDSIKYLDKKYGKIDALVNNAYPRNANYGRHFFDVDYTDFIENTGLNLGGYFLTSQQYSKYFSKQGYGNIVNISSIYGVVAPKFEIYEGTSMTVPVEYAAIKSGQIHLTEYMAKYFKGMGIRVNAISPGGILDNQPKSFLEKYKDKCLSKGMLDKSDLVGTLTYLLSDMSQYVNGQNILIDDGFTL
jgi:NAD(P)-dependent dehydrogenase (short-subunit alcohol dehydrogenase family)